MAVCLGRATLCFKRGAAGSKSIQQVDGVAGKACCHNKNEPTADSTVSFCVVYVLATERRSVELHLMEAMSRPRGGSSRSGPRGSLPTGGMGYVPRTSDALTTHFPPGLDWRRLSSSKIIVPRSNRQPEIIASCCRLDESPNTEEIQASFNKRA